MRDNNSGICRYGLRFISSDNLVQAVVHVDLAYIDCAALQNRAGGPHFSDLGSTLAYWLPAQSGSSIPDVVLNTHPEEPSVPPSLPPARLAEAEPEPAPSPPRRKLVRRAATGQSSAKPEPSSSTTASTTPGPEATPNSGEPPQEEQPFKLRRVCDLVCRYTDTHTDIIMHRSRLCEEQPQKQTIT